MSQTKVWTLDVGTTTRVARSSGVGTGCGQHKHLLVGRVGTSFDYASYLKPSASSSTLWSGVGKIVSAYLVVYTDDESQSGFGEPAPADQPRIETRRLTSSFTEGNNLDGDFDASDYVHPTTTSSDAIAHDMAKTPSALNRINITAMIEDVAPSTVKRRNGLPGGKATFYGLRLAGYSDATKSWSGWSDNADDALLRPTIELTYELGPTVPTTPANLTPSGAVAAIGTFEADFADARPTDTLSYSEVEVYKNDGTTLVWSSGRVKASAIETSNGRTALVPSDLVIKTHTTYKWRIRQTDQEGQVSAWTALVSFSVTNTDPDAPTLTPLDSSAFTSMNGVLFRGGEFSDADGGDKLLAYQVQLSMFPEGDVRWGDADFILWDTGKVFVPTDATSWQASYGGASLVAGSYTWRARQWDQHNGVSVWSYAGIVLTEDFDSTPGSQSSIQHDVQVPQRMVIRAMDTNRGPGVTVAILENSKNAGATRVYNSPGGMHFTLPIDHPQISVIEPKQTHYSLQFYTGDGWRETYAGIVWDLDATDTDAVFTGIDYLAAFDLVQDERFDASNPEKSYASGGSKYVDKDVATIITNQLQYAIGLTDSPVGFITVGSIATMAEKVTIYTTMAPILTTITGLIDSHRQGSGKNTRISVVRTTTGAYQVKVVDDPGTVRDNLRLTYGELVQGYRVIVFGKEWASRVNGIARTRQGLKVYYKSESAPGIDTSVWGRIAQATLLDGINDENDLRRRLKQIALQAGKFGRHIALGNRIDIIHPFDGFDITDHVPVAIDHGAIDTSRFGSGYWTIYGVTWEANDDGHSNTSLTLLPRNDTVAPDPDLIPTRPISPQAEWQVGWVPPDPLTYHQVLLSMDTGHLMDSDELMDSYITPATGKFHIDITTGIISELQNDGTWLVLSAPPTVPKQDEAGVVPETRTLTSATGFSSSSVKVRVR